MRGNISVEDLLCISCVSFDIDDVRGELQTAGGSHGRHDNVVAVLPMQSVDRVFTGAACTSCVSVEACHI